MMYIHFCFEIFLRLFNKCLAKHAPLEAVPKKEKGFCKNPGLDGIKTLTKVRDKLYKQMIKEKDAILTHFCPMFPFYTP